MPNIVGPSGNISPIKRLYKKWLSYGEKITGNEYKMSFDGYPDLNYLVTSSQLPALQREVVESYGPMGVKFNQMGRYVNAQDVPVGFSEVIEGKMYSALREIVRQKIYLDITIGLVSESQSTSSPFATVVLEDSWIELEGVDLSDEDGAALIKPAGTIHANWVSWVDEDGQTISIE